MNDPAHRQSSGVREGPADTGLHCVECDYNLTGVQGDRCPECGWEIDEALVALAREEEPPHTRRTMLALLAGLAGSASIVAAVLVSSPSLGHTIILWRVCTAVVGALHLLLAAWSFAATRNWPIRSGVLAVLCRAVAAVQLCTVVIFLLASSGPGTARLAWGMIECVVLFSFMGAPGIALLVATAIAITKRDESVRLLRRKLDRQTEKLPDGAPFTVAVAGRYPADAVRVIWKDLPRQTNEALDDLIEKTWREKLDQAERTGQLLFNGWMARLIELQVDGEMLTLILGPTNYRDFVGTNLYNGHLVATLGDAFFSNALGTSATVITRDGYLLYGRRNDKVAYHGGYLHTFGGTVETSDRTPDGTYDVFAAVRRELREELSLADEEIGEVVCTGLARDHQIHQPELLFDVQVNMTRRELVARFDAHADPEHVAIESCLDEPESIAPFVTGAGLIAPVAVAAMLLHGRGCWGHDWYENTSYVLFGEMPPEAPERAGRVRFPPQ